MKVFIHQEMLPNPFAYQNHLKFIIFLGKEKLLFNFYEAKLFLNKG